MNKLVLIALAASAAVLPAAASAQVVVHHTPGTFTHGRAFFHGGMFPHRLHPGFVVPPLWFGPQFHINNWQTYGFPPPPPRHRWVRYYDDAYLIDHDGRIRDTRYGLDWDRYDEEWDLEDGIPHYEGRGDFRPGEEDYAWVERHRRHHGDEGYDYAGHGPGYGPPGCDRGPGPCGGYAWPAYGYGYGVIAYPIVIETTVVSGGCGCAEDVVEEVVQYRQPPRPRPRPRRPRPAPPPPGERG